MIYIPKKVTERLSKTTGKFQKILKIAKDRDINEADTVLIVGDILSELFGFDKYVDITSEYAIRNTYCDLAIKMNGKIQYIIEVKAVGLDLKDNHLRQVIEYGANQGVQWVVLTNGIVWEIYCIKFEKPLDYDLICSFNMLELNCKRSDEQEKLFLLCKEGIEKSAREDFHERVQCINRFVIAALVNSDAVLNVVKRELKKLSSGIKVEHTEIIRILENEVLKRDVIEGEAAAKARSRVKRAITAAIKKAPVIKPQSVAAPTEDAEGKVLG